MSTNTNIKYKDFINICRTCMITSDLKPLNHNNVIIQVLHNLTDISFETNDELPQQICTKCYEKIIEINAFALQCKQTHLCLTKSFDESKIGIQIKEEILDIEETEIELVKKETPDFEEVFIPNPSCVKVENEATIDNEKQSSTSGTNGTLIPEKSRRIYDFAYEKFFNWAQEQKINNYTENVLLNYFSHLAHKMKSSSLWAQYSMIKAELNMKHHVNIENYTKLITFLKGQRHGYKPKKSKVLTKQQFDDFLRNAPNSKYLATKVIMIFGITGGCRCEELLQLTIDDIEDLEKLIFVKIRNDVTKKSRSFNIVEDYYINIYREYAALRPKDLNISRFFIRYQNGRCHRIVMEIIAAKPQSRRKIYTCDICKKTFKYSTSYKRHKSVHSGERPYECDTCLKVFKEPGNLLKHKKIHLGERPYQCDICNKTFSGTSNLANHKRTHTTDRPYECDVCAKAFKRLGVLILHKRIHSGERPAQCDLCFKTFKDSSNLMTHKKTHSTERPYRCDVCSKCFKLSGDLMRHKRIHSGERPYKCDLCAKAFIESGALSKHRSNIHFIKNK